MIYFPSCKFTVKYPQISQKVKNYMKHAHGAEISGCCRPNLSKITDADTVVYICNSCAVFSNESTPAKGVISVWELLLEDSEFQYPDCGHSRLTVQDCWRTYDNRPEQEAIRRVLDKMNVNIVEQKDNYAKTGFCGFSLYEPLPARYDEFAPKRFVADAKGFFQARPQQEKEVLMERHCGGITTPEAVCYCVACVNGINLGGKKGIHLAELVFGNQP